MMVPSQEGLNNIRLMVEGGEDLNSILDAYISCEFTVVDGRVIVDPGVVADIKEAQAYLDEIVNLSKEEIEEKTLAYNEAINATIDTGINEKINPLSNKIHDLVEDIETTSSDDAGTDEACYLLEELAMTIFSFQQVDNASLFPTYKPEEWHAEEIKAATENLQRKIQLYEFAQEKVNETNAALRIIKTRLNK